MIRLEYLCQPHGKQTYRHLFQSALSRIQIEKFDVAVAYATPQGVTALSEIMATNAHWEVAKKRWLIGIDWCRTDPTALEMLEELRFSSVRIFDGRRVVRRQNCTPVTPFHPKGFLIRGAGGAAIVSGSGNLSRNGLCHGHELGCVVSCGATESGAGAIAKASCERVFAWFESKWREASPIVDVIDDYNRRYDSADNIKSPAPTEDDAADEVSHRGSGLTAEQIRKLRAARNFWIRFVKNPNRGAGRPGSQLMLSRMMRVYFGFPAFDVPIDTLIGDVTIRFGRSTGSFSLRFSNNAMDVLNLPVPGVDGPPTYDGMVLVFRREAAAHEQRFNLRLAMGEDAALWERRSRRSDSSYRMSSGRPWGVF